MGKRRAGAILDVGFRILDDGAILVGRRFFNVGFWILDFGLVGRFDDGGEDFSNALDFLDQNAGLAFGKNFPIPCKPKPVMGFTSLLCRDAHL